MSASTAGTQEWPALRGMAARLGRKPVVGIVSMSPIADDPRVRRQGDALHAASWEVHAFGQPSHSSPRPAWRIEPLTPGASAARPPALSAIPRDWRSAVVRGLRLSAAILEQIASPDVAYKARLLTVYADPRQAERVYWSSNRNFAALYALASTCRADLWLGNDWTSLPIVARLAAEQGVPYVYDTHEFAAEEFDERRLWRYVQRPVRVETERTFIRNAAVVSTVSDGIAERLRVLHDLPDKPLTIRSTPVYQAMPFRPTGERIRVLYHGAVWEHRGLEACIRSVASWRPEFDFTIRGPISEAYRAILESEIDTAGVRGRVHIVPPVAMTDLVREASVFDVGLFALPGHSQHNEYALPNKFFEYTMAGLALCVSDLPEMARLIEKYDQGVLMTSVEPAAIAEAINSLDAARIDSFKRQSQTAARELCWETEQVKMLSAYRGALAWPDEASS